jgi:hypothetical protein
MRASVIPVIVLVSFFFIVSCTVSKRHYRRGFYVHHKGTAAKHENIAVNFPETPLPEKPAIPDALIKNTYDKFRIAITKEVVTGQQNARVRAPVCVSNAVKNEVSRPVDFTCKKYFDAKKLTPALLEGCSAILYAYYFLAVFSILLMAMILIASEHPDVFSAIPASLVVVLVALAIILCLYVTYVIVNATGIWN